MQSSRKYITSFLVLASFAFGMLGCNDTDQPVISEPALQPAFEAEVLDSNVSIGYGLTIGHVDHDRQPDILLADKKQFVWYQNGSWERHILAEDLTARDNVAIAARDIDGDGLVEVAVGAMWNPGETNDASLSGSVHYLIRPDDPTQKWEPVALHHEPTTHRMQWVKTGNETFDLVVLPLHGVGNEGGEGAGVKVIAYSKPADPRAAWPMHVIDNQMHMTHNFDVQESQTSTTLYLAGKEGVRSALYNGQWPTSATAMDLLTHGAGEVRISANDNLPLIATIEPIHGTHLVAYVGEENRERVVLDSTFAQGHALAVADVLNLGRDQIIAGWRNPNTDDKVGIKLYIPDETGTTWSVHIIDDNTMACEDLKVADLDGDGKLDIIAAGRATNNLIVYWNKSL